jgi:hypothetical protein
MLVVLREIFFDSDMNIDHLLDTIEGSNSINVIDIFSIFKKAKLRANIFTTCLPLPLAMTKIREGMNKEPFRLSLTATGRSGI